MKKLIYFSFILFIAAGCKKNNASNDGIPAQNFSNVSYGNDAAQKMDLYLPAGRSVDSTKLIILVHGGAWSTGDKSDFVSYLPALQQRLPGYAIANINYRLATISSNHFPTQETDMKAAVDFLVSKSNDYHFSQKFVLLGASSGAHMVLLQAYKYASPKISAVVDFFGPADMTALYDFYPAGSVSQFAFQALMNGTPATNASLYAESSPVNYISSQSAPTIIFHGSIDDVVPVSQSTNLKTKLQAMGVTAEINIYQNLGHEVWPPSIMADAFDNIQVFLKAYVH